MDEQNELQNNLSGDTQEVLEGAAPIEEKDVEETDDSAAEPGADEKRFCVQCGAELADGQVFCPKCGHKVGGEAVNTVANQPEKKAGTSNAKKLVGITVGVLVGAVAIIMAIFAIRGVQAKDITLNKRELSVKSGEVASLTFTINPTDTKDKTVTWTTSNEAIAQVNDGTITGVNEGYCVVTVTTKNGKTDSCEVTVLPAGPDLQGIYYVYCSSLYASVASDGSYLSIDTNPYDIDDYFDVDAYSEVMSVNEALGLPESVLNQMNRTRALDGMQSYSTDEIEVTWTYHPDNGLEVNYSLK